MENVCKNMIHQKPSCKNKKQQFNKSTFKLKIKICTIFSSTLVCKTMEYVYMCLR